MNRNYSDAHDPDMSTAEYHGHPSAAELARDAELDRWETPAPDCGDCGLCLRCAWKGLAQ